MTSGKQFSSERAACPCGIRIDVDLHRVKCLATIFHEIDGGANQSLTFIMLEVMLCLCPPEVEAVIPCCIQIIYAVLGATEMDISWDSPRLEQFDSPI